MVRYKCDTLRNTLQGKRTRLRNKWTNRFIVTRAGNVPIEKFVQVRLWHGDAWCHSQTNA